MNIWKETQPIIWIDIEDFFSITRNKIIISSWTAAEFYGFSNFVNKELNFTVPISYNNKSLRAGAKVKQRNAEKISFQLETYMYEDKVINIYKTLLKQYKDDNVIIGFISVDERKVDKNFYKTERTNLSVVSGYKDKAKKVILNLSSFSNKALEKRYG